MTIRYLCPICDNELVARGFCSSCKRFIKEPIQYKGEYLPNEDMGNYTLNRNMSEGERRIATENNNQMIKRRTVAAASAARTYSADFGRNSKAASARVNTDYGNCGGHKDSDYGVPNVDPHSAKKKKKSGFRYIVFIYIIIVIIKLLFNSLD